MTDPPTPDEQGPVDPEVELASAHLDGEVGAAERARVGDAAVQEHLETFGRVSEQVRDVPLPPPGLVDEQVARAMGRFDADDRVVPLDRRRTGPQPWWQRIPLGVVAAALVVVALIGAVGLASTGGDDEADTATAAFEAGDGSSGPGSGGGSAPTEDSGAAGTMEHGAAPDSGERSDAVGTRPYDSFEALADDLRAELSLAEAEAEGAGRDGGATTTADRQPGPGGDPCGAVGLLGIDPATVVVVRGVIVSTDEVTVVVHDATDGRRLTVVGHATCTVVHDRLL